MGPVSDMLQLVVEAPNISTWESLSNVIDNLNFGQLSDMLYQLVVEAPNISTWESLSNVIDNLNFGQLSDMLY